MGFKSKRQPMQTKVHTEQKPEKGSDNDNNVFLLERKTFAKIQSNQIRRIGGWEFCGDCEWKQQDVNKMFEQRQKHPGVKCK